MWIQFPSAEGAERSASSVSYSKVFPGRICCYICGLPNPPEQTSPEGVCSVCAEQSKLATAMIREGKVPSKFNAVLHSLKEAAGPATIGAAESFLDTIGGDARIGEMLAEDFKRLRGDGLSEEMKGFHQVDLKSLSRFYHLILNMLKERDELVKGTSPDPLKDIDEESLISLIATSAMTRIEIDPDFRDDVIRECYRQDAKQFREVYAECELGIPVRRTGVIVMVPDE